MLDRPRRLGAWAAAALLFTLFLPWYSETVVATSARGVAVDRLQPLAPESVSGWGAFSWIEAVALLAALGVLALLFRRAEGHPPPLPGIDGGAVTLCGACTCAVVIWAMFDKQGVSGGGRFVVSTGLDWGIFVALLAAGALTWAGTRIRAQNPPAHPARGGAAAGAPRPRAPRRRSSWRPADRPEWSDWQEPERAPGWLGARAPGLEPAPPRRPAQSPPEPPVARPAPPPRPASAAEGDQLTIPLNPEG